MQVYGSILPGAASLARLLPSLAAEGRAEVTLSRKGKLRLKMIRWHEEHGRQASRTAHHFGFSRPTIHAWLKRYKRAGPKGLEDRSHRPHSVRTPTWSTDLERGVLAWREQFPRWGKDKLVVLLRRGGREVSTSMVGRILKHLKDTGQLIEPLPERRKRRKHPPRPYAIRKPKGYLAKEPGDLVEVDTVDLRPLPGVSLKHFTARDVISRWDVLGVYTRATANTAAQFLDAIQARSPQDVKAIQVDGGSEFKADFEVLCQERVIRSSSCRRAHLSSTAAWSAGTAPTARSSTRSMTLIGAPQVSAQTSSTGSVSTTPSVLTSRSDTSLRRST